MNSMSRQANHQWWEGHVSGWSKSGLTQSAYCREHGLLPKTLSAWVNRMKKASAEPATSMTMVPVRVQRRENALLSSSIQLHHQSGWQVQLPCDVPVGWLSQLLKGLG